MARILFFSIVLRKLSEISNNKPILISTIFFTIMNISFFSLRFDLFSIIAKKVNQIRNNVVCIAARLVFMFRCGLTMSRCNAFQHIFVYQKKSEFYGPYVQSMLFLVTMVKKVFLKFLQNSQKCNCAGQFFSIKSQAGGMQLY